MYQHPAASPFSRQMKLSSLFNPGRLTAADFGLLRWVAMCVVVLLLVVLLMMGGVLYELELEQVRFLGGSPFFISAEEAQISLLGPAGTFALCIVVTLYMGLAYLREPRFGGRLQMALVSLVALALPGLLCVLWGGVLNMAAPLICALLCWLLAELDWFARWAMRHYRKNRP